jgi:hypothetical protein
MILVTCANTKLPNENLAIFLAQVEELLSELQLKYEVFLWKDDVEITRFKQDKLLQYEMVINIHSQFCWQSGLKHPMTINYIHEDKVRDDFTKSRLGFLNKLWGNNYSPIEKAQFNIFVSEETLKNSIQNGFSVNYSRDLIINDVKDCKSLFHCLINTSEAA